MNKFRHKTMFLLTAGLIAAAAPLASAQAANRCDVLRVGGEAKACAAAAQGPTELRRFVERTRAIYGLYYEDYAQRTHPAAAAAASQDASKAAALAEPRQTASAQ
jgi:hypothetical protein